MTRFQPISNFNDAYDRLTSYFDSPGPLSFNKDFSASLSQEFPAIYSPSHPKPETTFTIVDEFVERASDKLDFIKTTKHQWDTYIKFPNTVLSRKREDGTYFYLDRKIEETQSTIINQTKAAADEWFVGTCVPLLHRAREAATIFVTGDPGSGKSTLFKYLLNRHRGTLTEQKTIISRFEALKFRARCSAPKDHRAVMVALETYIYQILLRDLLLLGAYRSNSSSDLTRSGDPDLSTRARVEDTLEIALSTIAIEDSQRIADYQLLLSALGTHEFFHKHVESISLVTCRSLVHYFALTKGYKFCIVVDGLDHISLASETYDPFNYKILTTLIDSLALKGAATNPEHVISLPFPLHSVFILRDTTFKVLFESRRTQLRLTRDKHFEIAPISPDVAIFSAICRGIDTIVGEGADETWTGEERHILMSALHLTVRAMCRRLAVQGKKYPILGIFNGDIRECLKFFGCLISWIAREGHARNEFKARPSIHPTRFFREILNFVNCGKARRVLRHRAYRIVEFLLFQSGWVFENAVIKRGLDAADRIAYGHTGGGELLPNNSFSGVVDNVFNYHVFSYPDHPDRHCLLEKIRMLQILPDDRDRGITETRLWNEMKKRVGYIIEEGKPREDVIKLLLFNGFISVRMMGNEIRLSRTMKSRLVLETLITHSIYLENVFHKTLFPEELISHIEDTAKDEKRLINWIVASVRNYFIFVSYIKAVEANPASDVECPPELMVADRIAASIRTAVSKIIRQDFRDQHHGPPASWAVNKAILAIEETLDLWRSLGYVA